METTSCGSGVLSEVADRMDLTLQSVKKARGHLVGFSDAHRSVLAFFTAEPPAQGFEEAASGFLKLSLELLRFVTSVNPEPIGKRLLVLILTCAGNVAILLVVDASSRCCQRISIVSSSLSRRGACSCNIDSSSSNNSDSKTIDWPPAQA